jgi:copper chaperone CopZ
MQNGTTEEMIMEKTIKVEGMHCKSCEMLISDVISEIIGVQKVSADSRKGTVTITATGQNAIDDARKLIVKEGYKVVG